MKTLGDNVKILINENKISSINELHQMLVEKFGAEALSRRSLSTILNKRIIPKRKTLLQLSQIFKCSIPRLIFNTEISFTEEDFMKLLFSQKYEQLSMMLCHDAPFSVEKLHIRDGKEAVLEFPKKLIKKQTLFFYCLRGMLEVADRKDPPKQTKYISVGQCFTIDTDMDLFLKNHSRGTCTILIVASPSRADHKMIDQMRDQINNDALTDPR